MTLLLKIPEEFEQHFKNDRFEDSLRRLNSDAHLLAGNYEKETANMLIHALLYAVPVKCPHGRLIDADALISTIANSTTKFADYENWEHLCDIIQNVYGTVPTIIPEDKEMGA